MCECVIGLMSDWTRGDWIHDRLAGRVHIPTRQCKHVIRVVFLHSRREEGAGLPEKNCPTIKNMNYGKEKRS